MAKSWQYALVTVLASGPIYFEVLPGLFSAPTLGLATLLVPYLLATYRLGHRETLRRILIGSSAVIGIFSVLTGYVNYLTDEWATPQYVYLPLLPLIQVPYVWLDYRWFTLAMWGLMVYGVRKRYYTSMTLGGQYPALMAANGFNDVIPLLFLTLAFVTFTGRRARAAQLLSLGMKQFANAFVFVFHILRRDWHQAAITVLVSIIFLLPFLVWDWKSAICTPVLDMPPNCQNTQNLTFNSVHSDINFALWPVWVVAVFYPTLRVATVRLISRLGDVQTTLRERLGRVAM